MASGEVLASFIELSRIEVAARAAGGDALYRFRGGEMRNVESYDRFVNAASAESEAFGQLIRGRYLSVATELGSGYSTTADGVYIVSRLLDDGLRLAEAQQLTGDSARETALEGVLEAFLTALAEGTSTTTHYVGLRGVSLSGTDSVDLGVGVLRYLDEVERRTFAVDGESAPGVSQGEVCLVTATQATWSVTIDPPTVSKQAIPTLTEIELLQALLVLAEARGPRERLRTAQVVWNRYSPYFYEGGSASYGQSPDLQWRDSDSMFNAVVTEAVGEAARELYPALAKVSAKDFGVFIRRLVSACLVYNAAPEDRLIDAAVAWEGALWVEGS